MIIPSILCALPRYTCESPRSSTVEDHPIFEPGTVRARLGASFAQSSPPRCYTLPGVSPQTAANHDRGIRTERVARAFTPGRLVHLILCTIGDAGTARSLQTEASRDADCVQADLLAAPYDRAAVLSYWRTQRSAQQWADRCEREDSSSVLAMDVLDTAGDPHAERSTSADLTETFIAHAQDVCFLRGHRDGVVTECNQAMATLLQLDARHVTGKPVHELLTEADAATLRAYLEQKDVSELLLNFVDTTQAPHSLRCQIGATEDELLLFGEPVHERERALQQQLLELNNSLTVMTREKARQAKALEQARAKLEATLEELDTSYWHLRKIQEVLPICTVCGRVKTGDSSWEQVVDYLKRNSLFLSHGLCPDCLETMRSDWGLEKK